jgi:hypothetical protein
MGWFNKNKKSEPSTILYPSSQSVRDTSEFRIIVVTNSILEAYLFVADKAASSPPDFQQQYTDLQKQMLEQQSMLIELSGKAGSSINTANSYNNNTFNVNMFLNEYCKNAVTIESFIDSIETTRDDVMYLTRHGNKAGMTKIITNALGQLGVTERPIHCTDLKRHTTYIKDSEGWNKEQAQEKLRRLLCNTQHKCLQRAIEILDSDPNYQKNGTPEYEERIKMMSEVTSDEGEEQVIRKIQETAQLNREIATSGQGAAVLTV